MAAINPFAVFSGIVFVVFILGLHNFFTDYEENGCDMTYMFEYPQYVVSFDNVCKLIRQRDWLNVCYDK
jgi:hypothetical protein